MKAVIFALIVLLGVDVGVYKGGHLRQLRVNAVGFTQSIGAWVYYS